MGVIVGLFLGTVIERELSDVSTFRTRPHCSAPMPRRSALVAALTGAVWVLVGLWSMSVDVPGVSPLLPIVLVVASAGVALAFIDLGDHRLPDKIVLPLWPATIAGLALAGALSDDWPLRRALASSVLWILVIGGLWLVTGGRGMGFGDVKLAPVLGVVLGWIGWGPPLVGLAAACLAGGLVSLVMIVTGRARRGQSIPFGPFLILGFMFGVLLGTSILEAYAAGIGIVNPPAQP
jgi:leader peptidase (prepilin peptidase)/N-methyltransferase